MDSVRGTEDKETVSADVIRIRASNGEFPQNLTKQNLLLHYSKLLPCNNSEKDAITILHPEAMHKGSNFYGASVNSKQYGLL